MFNKKRDQNITERLSQINSFIEQIHAEQAKTKETLNNTEDDADEGFCQARVTFSGSWANDKAEDVQWASSMETKRYPIVVFNSKILSDSDSNPVGSRYHLTYKLNNSEARIISQIFQANGFKALMNILINFMLKHFFTKFPKLFFKKISTIPKVQSEYPPMIQGGWSQQHGLQHHVDQL